MPLTALESNLLNLADSVVQGAASLVAQKNPAYDSLITLASGLVDQINANVNPTAPAAAGQIATAATALTATVANAPAAVATITNSGASAAQKASAAGIILGDVESVGASIAAFFHKL